MCCWYSTVYDYQWNNTQPPIFGILWMYYWCWYSVFLIINIGIPTPTINVINITVVVGIWFTMVIIKCLRNSTIYIVVLLMLLMSNVFPRFRHNIHWGQSSVWNFNNGRLRPLHTPFPLATNYANFCVCIRFLLISAFAFVFCYFLLFFFQKKSIF